MTISEAFTALGKHIEQATDYLAPDTEDFLEAWLEEAPFYRWEYDPTDSDRVGKLLLCMVCNLEADDPTAHERCPNHAVDRLAGRAVNQ